MRGKNNEHVGEASFSISPQIPPPELKSPPVQTMEQPEGYDPNRIPASVFSTSSPGDWSGASNESLFSIQMGNNSFSKDYAILFGKSGEVDWNNPQSNPFKSGELPRLDEWKKSNDLGSTLPPVMEDSGEFCQSPAPSAKPPTSSPTHAHAHSHASPSRFSDVSGQSNSSFAFPVLASDSAKTDYSVRVAPEKIEPKPQKAVEKPKPPEPQPHKAMEKPKLPEPQPQPQPQARAQPPLAHALKAPGTRWFSCFSCSWPRFC